MKASSEQALLEFKDRYSQVFGESRHSQTDEALSLGVDVTTAHNYLRCDTDRHLPSGLLHKSIFAPQLVEYIAERIGGVFVPLTGHLNGSSNDELSAILKLCAQAVREPDATKRAKLFKRMEKLAERAAREEGQ